MSLYFPKGGGKFPISIVSVSSVSVPLPPVPMSVPLPLPLSSFPVSFPDVGFSLPVLLSLPQLVKNSNVSDNNAIRNILKEFLVKMCNSRFALLNVYTVIHFAAFFN